MKETKCDYYERLYRLVLKLNSALSTQEILRLIVTEVPQAMNARACSLMLLTSDKKELLHAAAYGLSDWFFRKGPIIFDKSISDTLEGTPVNIHHAADDNRVIYSKQIQQEGIASILSIPVTLRDSVVGVMRIYSSEPYLFQSKDISFACTAANFGAIVMENLGCIEALQKEYDLSHKEMVRMHAEMDLEENICDTQALKEAWPIITVGG